MAKIIPDDPKQRNALLIGVGLLLLLYPFNSFWYAPRREEVTAMQTRLESLEDQNRRAQMLAARGGGDLDELTTLYQRHIEKLEQLIPAAEEVPGLVDDINNRSRFTGVDVNRIIPEGVEAGAFYDQTAYELVVIGEYHNVARFLTDIASMPRIVTPVDLDMVLLGDAGLFPDYQAPVQANFRIRTYVLPDRTAAPPAEGVQG